MWGGSTGKQYPPMLWGDVFLEFLEAGEQVAQATVRDASYRFGYTRNAFFDEFAKGEWPDFHYYIGIFVETFFSFWNHEDCLVWITARERAAIPLPF